MRREDSLPVISGTGKEEKHPRIIDIRNRIYIIRGVQVMLDRDLAELYGVKARRLREQVKRNATRFPKEFMFHLDDGEVNLMVSQNATPSKRHLGGSNPFVFTEQGVAMLSAVLRSETAVKMSIEIMKAFVAMRHFITENAQVFARLDALELKQMNTDKKMKMVLEALEAGKVHPRQGIFFDGQVFDAHIFLSDLFRSATNSIEIIDNYIDDSVLAHLTKRKKGVRVIIHTRNIQSALSLDARKLNEQYPPVEVKRFESSHDRFIIIDERTVYHFGASLKDLGKKWFAFSRMDIEAAEILVRLRSGR